VCGVSVYVGRGELESQRRGSTLRGEGHGLGGDPRPGSTVTREGMRAAEACGRRALGRLALPYPLGKMLGGSFAAVFEVSRTSVPGVSDRTKRDAA